MCLALSNELNTRFLSLSLSLRCSVRSSVKEFHFDITPFHGIFAPRTVSYVTYKKCEFQFLWIFVIFFLFDARKTTWIFFLRSCEIVCRCWNRNNVKIEFYFYIHSRVINEFHSIKWNMENIKCFIFQRNTYTEAQLLYRITTSMIACDNNFRLSDVPGRLTTEINAIYFRPHANWILWSQNPFRITGNHEVR